MACGVQQPTQPPAAPNRRGPRDSSQRAVLAELSKGHNRDASAQISPPGKSAWHQLTAYSIARVRVPSNPVSINHMPPY
eukprot:CAMPEP_0172084982 /NCGR_PEP_ID=MMETSP1043-20130122/21293_1 /TAXON_ID=464988 /ORGANISM="Hemiselmis andersenii, Strain CCMP441" /LENGTH=78 /DNA_ID=CAMNT_0012746861 /DNA_START=50 /DNA_END=282 /DNA_ORIENTATION=-